MKSAASEFFDPKNIFRYSGHGKQLPEDDRYILKPNEYALISGKCGNVYQSHPYKIFETFFKRKKPIKLFDNSTDISEFNIQHDNALSYMPNTKNTTPLIIQKKDAEYKFYYPRKSDSNKAARVSLPQLFLRPAAMFLYKDEGKIVITISGIINQQSSRLYSKYRHTGYQMLLDYTEEAFNMQFNNFDTLPNESNVKIAKQIFDAFEIFMRGSMLTFDNLLAMATLFYINGKPIEEIIRMPMDDIMHEAQTKNNGGKFYKDLTLQQIYDFGFPIEFIYNFLQQKIKKPFLVIFDVCRKYVGAKENISRKRAESANLTREASSGGSAGGGRKKMTRKKLKQ
jgi:hypothetical protein